MARFAQVDASIGALRSEAGPEADLAPILRAAVAEAACTDQVDRAVLSTWVRGEYENLIGAPAHQLSANHASEPYRLPGADRFITSALDEAVAKVAVGLDLRLGARVTRIEADADRRWRVSGEGHAPLVVDAVVVTIAIGALQGGRVTFAPPLPEPVQAALGQIGMGAVAKVFVTFDRPWWLPLPAFWLAAEPAAELELWVDGSALSGVPTLFAFALGEHAHAVEAMSEDELCALAWANLRRGGAVPG